MTTLYVPLHLPAVQAKRFLERELRHRVVDSLEVRGNLLVVEHYPRTVQEMTDKDILDYYGMREGTIIVY